MAMSNDPQQIERVLRRGVAEIIIEREMRARLAEGKPLRLKMGFDPSRPDLHLGYAVALRKLRQFQDLGHRVILIVGDWTARIGDPTGRSETRQMLTEAEVNANAQTYMRQFFKIVDRDRTEVVFQSTWFGAFGLAEVVQLTSHFTVAQMLAREDFAKRYAEQRPIALTEFLYPLLQGYDSVAIRSDVEFGGMDQKFNCLVGRDLQQIAGQRPQQVFLMPLLLGTDGRKMSQSYGNYIAFEEPPNDMYGKLMRIPDAVMLDYLELLTDVPEAELEDFRAGMAAGGLNPMAVKHRLASEVVTQFHDAAAAHAAAAHFRRVVQERRAPDEIPEYNLGAAVGSGTASLAATASGATGYSADLRDLLVNAGLAASKSEAMRLIRQGAVEIDGEPFMPDGTSTGVSLYPGSTLRVGKRRFLRLTDSSSSG